MGFSYGNFRISRIRSFKNRSFSSGQEVVQIEPISVWSILCAPKAQNKINCLYSLSRKKIAFHTEICNYFEYLFFKYSIFHGVKKLFKLNQTRYVFRFHYDTDHNCCKGEGRFFAKGLLCYQMVKKRLQVNTKTI